MFYNSISLLSLVWFLRSLDLYWIVGDFCIIFSGIFLRFNAESPISFSKKLSKYELSGVMPFLMLVLRISTKQQYVL